MNGRHHLISGAATLVAASCAVTIAGAGTGTGPVSASLRTVADGIAGYMLAGNPPFSIYAAVCVALYMVGCILPDVDNSRSMAGKRLHVKLKHRTWTHSLWPVILIAFIGFIARPITWLAAGYFVHLIWDSMSRMGVCWLYPHPGFICYENGARVKRGHWLWLYRAESRAEMVVCYLSVVLALAMVIWLVAAGAIPLWR